MEPQTALATVLVHDVAVGGVVLQPPTVRAACGEGSAARAGTALPLQEIDDEIITSLNVREDIGSRLERTGKRAANQKRIAAFSKVVLPAKTVQALSRSVRQAHTKLIKDAISSKKAGGDSESEHEARIMAFKAAKPAQVLEGMLSQWGLRVDAERPGHTNTAAGGTAAPPADALGKAVAEVGVDKEVYAEMKKVLQYAKKLAYSKDISANKAALTNASAPGAIVLPAAETAARPVDGSKPGSLRATAVENGSDSMQTTSARKRPLPSSTDSHQGGVPRQSKAARKNQHLVLDPDYEPQPRSAGIIEDVPPAKQPQPAAKGSAGSSKAHVHGRGAGAGRGLHHNGEPKFEDMHPSWQAHRRQRGREAKAISKALRSAPAEAVEVPS